MQYIRWNSKYSIYREDTPEKAYHTDNWFMMQWMAWWIGIRGMLKIKRVVVITRYWTE